MIEVEVGVAELDTDVTWVIFSEEELEFFKHGYLSNAWDGRTNE